MKIDEISVELSYQNVYLIPKKTIVDSRSDCDVTVQFGPRKFDLPIVPANMKSVVSQDTCKYLAQKNLFYIMHRFDVDVFKFIEFMKKDNLYISISVGVNEESYQVIRELKVSNIIPEYITIDTANGWSVKTEKMTKFIKDTLSESFLIVGNVATAEATMDLDKWGADAIKAGISGGKSCITKLKTSFHRPMVNTIKDCSQATNKPVIADGGVCEHGHVAVAMACGAEMVMCGFLCAAFDESSGSIIEIDNKCYKEYYGSASKYNKNQYKNIEGKKILVPYKGSMDKFLTEIKEDIQSAVSYAGGKDLSALRNTKMILSY